MVEKDWREKRVLVTGGSGVLGTALAEELKSAGYRNVSMLSRLQCDLLNLAQTKDAFASIKPELVFHLAGKVQGVMGNLKNQGGAFFENTILNTHVVEAARLSGVRKVVAMGTTAIYSDRSPLPKSEDSIWDGAPHGSEAGYAQAKRGLLAQLMAYEDQYGLEYAYCISTNLYGPNDRFDEQYGHVMPSLVARFHRCREAKEDIVVWGSGIARRDFLYSADAAAAIRLIAERGSGPINVASGRIVTIRECVELVARASSFSGNIIWDQTKPDGQLERAYDLSRLKAIGFEPKYSLEEGIKITCKWYESNFSKARL